MSLYGVITPTKVHEIRGLTFNWPDPENCKFHRAPTKSVRDIRCGNILFPGKVSQSSLYSLQIYHQSTGRTRVSIDTVK